MGDNTGIEWTDATWNPVVGCSVVSPGCTNCYAMKFAGRMLDGSPKAPHYAGTTQKTKGGHVWTGKLGLAPDHILTAPLRWKKPRRIFVNSMGDLFHEDCPDEWIDRVFAVILMAPQHTFQILTKRASRMRDYVTALRHGDRAIGRPALELCHERAVERVVGGYFVIPPEPWPNVWLGVSAEDQRRADERIPYLLQTPAVVRFVSAEPLLGPVNLTEIGVPDDQAGKYAGHGYTFNALWPEDDLTLFNAPAHIDWVIVGGESGANARPMHPEWARLLRRSCEEASTHRPLSFFFKQWGEWHPDALLYTTPEGQRPPANMKVGKAKSGCLLDGREHKAFPEVVA